MGAALLIYAFLSTLDFSLLQSIFFRPYHHNFFTFFIFIFLLLKVIGCMVIEEPFSSLGQLLAIGYFGYILGVWSICSTLDLEHYLSYYNFFKHKVIKTNLRMSAFKYSFFTSSGGKKKDLGFMISLNHKDPISVTVDQMNYS